MAGQPDIFTMESWRSLQLDVQVSCPSFFPHLPPAGVLPSNSSRSTIQYTLFKMHSPTSSHGPNPYRPAHLARAKRTSKSRCSLRRFHPYSSSIKAFLIRCRHGWRSQDQQACPVLPGARNPTRYGISFFLQRSKAENSSWSGLSRHHGTRCRTSRATGAIQA